MAFREAEQPLLLLSGKEECNYDNPLHGLQAKYNLVGTRTKTLWVLTRREVVVSWCQ
jgi:hypothetical protein